jgi:Transglycosylase SLT domain
MTVMKRLISGLLVATALSATPIADAVAAPAATTTVKTTVHPAVTCNYHHWSYNVERWHSTAIAQGWSQCQWYHLSCIIYRESRGNPMAYNRYDAAGGSRGLTQINGVHAGWLGRAGIIRWPYDLFTGWRNLRAAKALYNKAGGWSPWGRCG